LRWIYILNIVIPMFLGMMTTMLILTFTIGPPVAQPPIQTPPWLLIESINETKIGNDIVLVFVARNPGDQSLYIMRIVVNNKTLVNSVIEVGAKGSRFVHVALPSSDKQLMQSIKRKGGILDIVIYWKPFGENTEYDYTTRYVLKSPIS